MLCGRQLREFPKLGFLDNLVKVFPSLATRPLHITGESYAGYYIVRTRPGDNHEAYLMKPFHPGQPYITKTYFGMRNPPVKLAKIAIGDGSMNTGAEFIEAPAVRIFPSPIPCLEYSG